MWNVVYFLVFLISFSLSAILTGFFRKVALNKGLVDRPAPRKVHQVPTPLLGGAGVISAFLLTVGLGLLSAFLLFKLAEGPGGYPWGPQCQIGEYLKEVIRHLPGALGVLPRLLIILSGGVLVFLFGLLDDIVGIKAGWKLLGQTLIGSLLFFWDLRITLFLSNPFFSFILTLGWFLLVTNSFNLLDNMDGLATGIALIASFLFFLYASQIGTLFIATLLSVFAGACAGFLRYNFPPAKIFLGEAGSTFLGYFLAVISITATFYCREAPTFLPVLAPIFILAIPLFDTLSVMIIRTREGRSIFTPGKDHLSHRLLKFGLSQRESVLVIYFLALGLGLPALLLRDLNLSAGLLLLLQGVLFLFVLTILESKQTVNTQ